MAEPIDTDEDGSRDPPDANPIDASVQESKNLPSTTPSINTPTATPTITPTPTPPPTLAPTTVPIPATFTLSTSVEPTGSGSVFPTSGSYEEGTTLTLNATPSSTYEYGDWRDTLGLTQTKHAIFNHWSGDALGTSSNTTIVMDSNKMVVAHFSIVPIASIEITAIELAREYATDETQANSKYQHRTVQVTGKITSVSTSNDLTKKGFVKLDVPAGQQFGGIMCQYVYPSKMDLLVIGQTVTIQGTVGIYHMSTVLIENCSLVE